MKKKYEKNIPTRLEPVVMVMGIVTILVVELVEVVVVEWWVCCGGTVQPEPEMWQRKVVMVVDRRWWPTGGVVRLVDGGVDDATLSRRW
jgi:hypothetical protein